MRKNPSAAFAIIALSVFTLTCQRAAPPPGNTAGAGPSNSPGASRPADASQPPAAPVTHLKVGDPAPDFALTDTEGQTVRLSDFRGKKNVVLAFTGG